MTGFLGQMGLGTRLLAALRDRTEGAWHVAEFELPTGNVNAPIVPETQGLIMWYVVVANPRVLVTFWASRDAFETDKANLTAALSIGTDSRLSGNVRDVHPPPRFWRRIRPASAMIFAVTFIGALVALRGYFDWLFLPAKLTPRVDRSSAVYYVVGEKLDELITVTNHTALDHRGIRFEASANSRDISDLVVDPAGADSLAPGGLMTLRVRSSETTTLGSHKVTLAITSKAGRWWPASQESFSFDVIVWPKHPVVELALSQQTDNRAVLIGLMQNGNAAEHGLKCMAELTGDIPIKDVIVDMPRAENQSNWMATGSGPTRTGYIEWELPGIEKYRRTSLRLLVIQVGKANWFEALRNSSVFCVEKP